MSRMGQVASDTDTPVYAWALMSNQGPEQGRILNIN